MPSDLIDPWKKVDDAFSKQSLHFDGDDQANPILQEWRLRVYNHVDRFLKPNSKILELNCGTGIDAIRFAEQGHAIHATDVSKGMLTKLTEKISQQSLGAKITVQRVAFDQLNKVEGKFDYVFSNFGGLNCIDDLKKVIVHMPRLLNSGAFITWVIMPKTCPWEWSWILKGKFKDAFRRFSSGGVLAHLEGEFFKTYYHPLGKIEKSFGSPFRLIESEGLGVFSPPPAAQQFVKRFPSVAGTLNRLDRTAAKFFLFNRWGDHVIATFEFK